MPIAIWSPAYITGDATVDAQHQKLFQLVNELHHGIVSGHGKDVMGPVLRGLASYTIEHFATEERLMATASYPNLPRHKAKHDGLTKQVKDLLREFEAGNLALPSTLSKFLADWLTHHIREEDMELIHWLQAQKK